MVEICVEVAFFVDVDARVNVNMVMVSSFIKLKDGDMIFLFFDGDIKV